MPRKPKDPVEPATYTVSEAAERVGVSKPTIYRAIESGRLKTFRAWERGDRRIYRAELEAWMRGQTADSAA